MKIDRSTLRIALTVLMILVIAVAVPAVLLHPRQAALETGRTTRFESYDQIVSLLETTRLSSPNRYLNGMMEKSATFDSSAPAAAGAQTQQTVGSTEHSTTNLQVAGVDEADIIKTDGSYLYLVANGRLLVYDVRKPATPTKTFEQVFRNDKESADPLAIYLDEDNDRLILLVTRYEYVAVTKTTTTGQATAQEKIAADAMMPSIMPYGKSYVSVQIFDLKNPAKPTLIRSFDQEGSYIDSRRIDKSIYVLTAKYTYGATKTDVATVIPQYRVGGEGAAWNLIPAQDISVYPAQYYESFLVISAINSVDGNAKPTFESMLGYGNNVYVSPTAIYVAAARYEQPVAAASATDSGVKTTSAAPDASSSSGSAIGKVISGMIAPVTKTTTDIYRFSISGGKVAASGSGSVPGTLLNQFAMDEHDGYLRIATTTGEAWRTDANTSTNNLYILDASLKQVGAIEGLARKEQIKSVRFIGDRAYLVTFRTTDPLFVIDVSKPTAPIVLGELKIPGFSEYLHPYSENLLIGFGQNAAEVGDRAYTLGLKISMFDVSDTKNPKEVSTLTLGDRGSYSEILNNHKALLFDSKSDVIGFPVSLASVPISQRADPKAYGYQYYNGFVVLGYSEAGFKIRGFVSHIDGANPTLTFATPAQAEAMIGKDNGKMWQETIYRGVTVGDTLFTFSSGILRGTSLKTFAQTGSAVVPGAADVNYGIRDSLPTK